MGVLAVDWLPVALNWFKEHFLKCNDRAALVKTWLPAQYDGPKAWLDQLVYDRALVLVCLARLSYCRRVDERQIIVTDSSKERASRSSIESRRMREAVRRESMVPLRTPRRSITNW